MSHKWLNEYNLLIADEIDSTNLESIRLIKAGVDGKFVIWAHNQTRGKGQGINKWQSADGNLYMSIFLCPDVARESLTQLSFVAALAVRSAISYIFKKRSVDSEVMLKWPNDIMIDDAKVGGILLESINPRKGTTDYIVIGIGLNVNAVPALSEERKISSLHEISGNKIEVHVILNKIMHYFDHYYKIWQTKNFTSIRQKWLKYAFNLGKNISVKPTAKNLGSEKISGVFKDIDFNGSLILKLSSGNMIQIHAGEISAEKNLEHSDASCDR